MNLKYIISIMLERALLWHKGGLEEWSVSDWGVAFGGEAGEVMDAIKKLRRLELGNHGSNNPATTEQAIEEIGFEVVDTFCYGILLCLRLGIDFEKVLCKKFNMVSQREGFTQRLELGHDSSDLISLRRGFKRGVDACDNTEVLQDWALTTPRNLHEQAFVYGWLVRTLQHKLHNIDPRMNNLPDFVDV